MKLTFDALPPSVNQLYKISTRGGKIRLYKTQAGKDFMEHLQWKAKTVWKKVSIDKIKLRLDVFIADKRRHDLDNLLKITLDSFNGIVWEDDSQVDIIEIYRYIGKKPKMIIEITELV